MHGIRVVVVHQIIQVQLTALHFMLKIQQIMLAAAGGTRVALLIQAAKRQYPQLAHRAPHAQHVIPNYLVTRFAEIHIRIPEWVARWIVSLPAAYHQVIHNAIAAQYPTQAGQTFTIHGRSVLRMLWELTNIYMRFPPVAA